MLSVVSDDGIEQTLNNYSSSSSSPSSSGSVASGSWPFISRSTRAIPRRAPSLSGSRPDAFWYSPAASASIRCDANTAPSAQWHATRTFVSFDPPACPSKSSRKHAAAASASPHKRHASLSASANRALPGSICSAVLKCFFAFSARDFVSAVALTPTATCAFIVPRAKYASPISACAFAERGAHANASFADASASFRRRCSR
mmetsp:Transcript_11275/g.41779  ORF Transcript_11275/g.41779 Transcript_11275/m.41779 type:complete len:202 (+) Transcript_11275:810-1415(+)